MKKSGIFLLPLLIFAVISFLGNRAFASGGMNPALLAALAGGAMLLMFLIRPKPGPGKAAPDAPVYLAAGRRSDLPLLHEPFRLR